MSPATATSTIIPLTVATPCGPLPTYPKPWPDRPRYRVNLRVDGATHQVHGDLEVRFIPEMTTPEVVFRLWANAPRTAGSGAGLEITTSSLDGEPIQGTYEPGGAAPGSKGTIFVLRPADALGAGKLVTATLSFVLTVAPENGDRVTRLGPNLRLGSILPTLSWIRGVGWQRSPAVDMFAEAAASEVADYDVHLALPAGHTALATGQESEPGRWVAKAVRDWGATIGPMRVARAKAQDGKTEVVVGVGEGATGNPERLAADAAGALDQLAALFGSYPYPQLSIGVTPQLSGGIEFPQHIQLGAGVARIHMVHEIAHQWFYGLVGSDQYRDPWLDEGLTSYAESRVDGRLAIDRRTKIPDAGRGRLDESMSYWILHPGAYYRSIYIQGLQALVAVADQSAGVEMLDCGLRRYVQMHAYALARPADLIDALAAQPGLTPGPVLAKFGVLTG